MSSPLHRVARYLRFLYYQRVVGFDVPETPHFDPESEVLFRSLLSRSRSYLEFGSGGSTILAASIGLETTTVENDRFFARRVQERIGADAKNHMIAIDLGLSGNWGTPLFKKPTAKRIMKWREYIEAPFRQLEARGGSFPDLVLVDGRFRRACALKTAEQAWAHGAPTKICFDDYERRTWYHDVESALGQPQMAGRMAIFDLANRQPVDVTRQIDEAIRDWR